MTFCKSDCTNHLCFRFFDSGVMEDAKKWWSHDPDNVPIAFSDFSTTCDMYVRKESKVE